AHLLREGTWRREAERLVERLGGRRSIALVTPTHLARNPRLVKEADALAAAGCDVDVFYCRFMPEVVEHDDRIVSRAAWRAHAVSYVREEAPFTFWWSRLRRHVCRKAFDRLGRRSPDWLMARAYERIYPELLRLVRKHAATQRAANMYPPDLYIAHNLQALPVALRAGRRHGARVGFDAEDFHTGMYLERDLQCLDRRLVVQVEERGIRACDYVTAAAPYIAEAYERRYEISRPETVLNTFPSAMRPRAPRPTDPEAPLTLYWFSQTIGPVRGLEDAAIAMARLADLPVELHLRGQVTDSAYVDYLRKLAGDAGERIVLHDLAPADEMIRLAAQYDVGLALETPVQHNRDICLSNKIFSYLAAGNAVLASGTTAQKALMQRLGPVGAVYSPGNGREMALFVRQWHESRELLDDRRQHAWRAATDRFNWEYEQDVFLRVITRLFDERRETGVQRSSAA
ncbi:MAG: hypothetical protein WD021_10300, partial [Rhodothermales bacterium]